MRCWVFVCDIVNVKLSCAPVITDNSRLEVADVVAKDSDCVAEISLCRTEYTVVCGNKATFYM